MNEFNWFYIFRNIAFFFAAIMLLKYTIFLLLAPLYSVKENLRKIKYARKKKRQIFKQHKISIIIPAYNEEVGILHGITSAITNGYDNYEIIVVNDGSIDFTERKVLRFIDVLRNEDNITSEKIKYYHKERGGKGNALNFGLEKATGDIILTMDADSALGKNALANLNVYFNDETISAVVGNVTIANPYTFYGFIQYLEYQFGFYFKRAHAFMGAEYIFGGACAAFRKSIFEEVGKFDVNSKTEDIEMSMRIRSYGHHCTYAEDVICYTEGPSTLMGLINQRLRWKKGRLDAFWKYRFLFFSRHYKHNKMLTFFVLPFSLIGEIQLFFEPVSITLLLAYGYISRDYLSLFLGVMFIFIIYIVSSLFTNRGLKPITLLLFPFSWPFFYILVWVEYLALLESIRITLSGQELKWQTWERKGISI